METEELAKEISLWNLGELIYNNNRKIKKIKITEAIEKGATHIMLLMNREYDKIWVAGFSAATVQKRFYKLKDEYVHAGGYYTAERRNFNCEDNYED